MFFFRAFERHFSVFLYDAWSRERRGCPITPLLPAGGENPETQLGAGLNPFPAVIFPEIMRNNVGMHVRSKYVSFWQTFERVESVNRIRME